MTEALIFQPHARLLTMLGDQLIKNERIALAEIIKNSYDADATWVKVTFKDFGPAFEVTPTATIIIEDDGDGIPLHVLTGAWLSPATPFKKLAKKSQTTTPSGRVVQGEKGIGRFALLKLGRAISLISRPKGENFEHTLSLDVTPYDEDFLSENGVEKPLMLSEIPVTLSSDQICTAIRAEKTELGLRVIERRPHGVRIEIRSIRGDWNKAKVDKFYEDVTRLQSIFEGTVIEDGPDVLPGTSRTGFEVFIYKDDEYQSLNIDYIEKLRRIIADKPVLKITNGTYDESSEEFRFTLNGTPRILDLDDTDITSLKLFRDYFTPHLFQGERRTSCGPFGFEFYVFDFSRERSSNFYLDNEDRKIVKMHRVYLYRDNIRVNPYGDPEDDWLQTDQLRGTISASYFLSNDQVVGHVDITQRENPKLADKTNREGLLEVGSASSDLVHLLQVFLAWVKAVPFKQSLAKQLEEAPIADAAPREVQALLDSVVHLIGKNADAKAALAQASQAYNTEREHLIRRAEVTESLAGVGLSVETASHDIMAVMHRSLLLLDATIADVAKPGEISKALLSKKLIEIRQALSFVEDQLSNLQVLFKSSKQRRREIQVAQAIQSVHGLFEHSLTSENISFRMSEVGPKLTVSSTEGVLLQLFLNLVDNAVYWLSWQKEPRIIEIVVDGNRGVVLFADNGPGVKPADEPYIFEPFYSGRGEDGKGLGLYIARQLLQRHGFSIDLARSQTDRILLGACFLIRFDDKDS